MPLHAGPPEVFKGVEEGGYLKVICTACSVTAQLSHCRCRKHLTKLAERLAKDKVRHVQWASKYLWEGDEAT
eukprot:7695429-Lingulodinium_polyedra.AAC.1